MWHHAPQNIRNHSPDDAVSHPRRPELSYCPPHYNWTASQTSKLSWWWCSPGHSAIFTLLTFPVSSYGHFKGFVHPFNQYLIIYFYLAQWKGPLTHQQIVAFWKTWIFWNSAVRTLDVTNKKILQRAGSGSKSSVLQVFCSWMDGVFHWCNETVFTDWGMNRKNYWIFVKSDSKLEDRQMCVGSHHLMLWWTTFFFNVDWF